MTGSFDATSFEKMLMPLIMDARAASGFERPFALYPQTKYPTDGFQRVTFARLANAVNRAAWWLDEHLCEAGKKVDSFAYFGPNDVRYTIFVLATMKTSRKCVLLLSSVSMKDTDSRRW
jgi:acyl-coenzyme A synthetase/AMP-(fatty) acid ligase